MGIKAWSNEEEQELAQLYENETKDVHEIASHFDKGYRSVISKLVNMGIYVKPDIEKKNNRTVKTMLQDLEDLLDIQIEGFNLNKKSNLLTVVEALEKKLGVI